MQVFDGDIASWGTLGWGGGDSIRLFRLDDITAYATPEELGEKLENVPQCLSRIVASHKNIIAYLPKRLRVFWAANCGTPPHNPRRNSAYCR